jgi:peptidoglycan hydrolase-like protein with peptidoglycan-binding domain
MASVLSQQSAPAAGAPTFQWPDYPGVVRQNMKGAKVGTWMYVMAYRGYPMADAVFGSALNNDIEDWKKRFKIVEQGGGPKTWHSLWNEAEPPGPYPPPKYLGNVSMGMTGAKVGIWYYAMRRRNYSIRDAVFGQDTLKKVKDWQSKHGLVADGVAGKKTWDSLQRG